MTNMEIDAFVAIKILNMEQSGHAWISKKGSYCCSIESWRPSGNISDAFKVVEKMREKGFYGQILFDKSLRFSVDFMNGVDAKGSSIGGELPLAICKSALRAIGEEA